ncbi:MAG: hypothetical protein ACOCSL_00825 [Thermoplasmatota archaeon]
MNIKKYTSIYYIFIGIPMIGMWIMFYINGQIPELNSEPVRIGMHLTAEFTTALMLILSGIALLKNWSKAIYIFQFSMGMLIYTLIQSPGYFAQQGEISFVCMFAIFILLALIFLIYSIKNPRNFTYQIS